MSYKQTILSELIRVKVLFQLRAIEAHITGSPTASAAHTPGGVCPPPFLHPAGLCLTQHDGEA